MSITIAWKHEKLSFFLRKARSTFYAERLLLHSETPTTNFKSFEQLLYILKPDILEKGRSVNSFIYNRNSKSFSGGSLIKNCCCLRVFMQGLNDLNNPLNIWWKLYLNRRLIHFSLIWLLTDKILIFSYPSRIIYSCWTKIHLSRRILGIRFRRAEHFLNRLKEQFSVIEELPYVKNYRLKAWKIKFFS